MKKKIILLLLVTGLYSCKHEKTLHKAVEIIQAKTELKANAADLFEQIRVVALETTDSSLVGLFISRIEAWDDKIFVFNELQSHNNILCFDLSGKFLFTIDRIGQGPEEYTNLYDFFIDKNLNHLVLLNGIGRAMHFDMQGNFLYNVYSKDKYFARHTVYLNDSTYLGSNDGGIETDVPKGTSLIYLDAKTMNVRDKSSSIDEYYYFGRRLSAGRNRILRHSYSDSIYDISDIHNIHVAYIIDNGPWQATAKQKLRTDIDRLTDYGEQMAFMSKFIGEHYPEGELLKALTIYENDKYLALGCEKPVKNTRNTINYVLFHDKQNGRTYNSENIDFGGVKLLDCSIYGADESLYCILYSTFSDEDKAKIGNSPVFTEADRKKLVEFQEEDNPLIIVLK